MNPKLTIASLLIKTGSMGVDLSSDPSDPSDPTGLRYRPIDLHVDLADRLRHSKADLLALLRGTETPDQTDPDSEAGLVMCERLEIADDLRMPAHPGSPAWLVAVGEGLHASCHMATGSLYSQRVSPPQHPAASNPGRGRIEEPDRVGFIGSPFAAEPVNERRTGTEHRSGRAAGGIPRSGDHRPPETDSEEEVK